MWFLAPPLPPLLLKHKAPVPKDRKALLAACPLNGVKWQAEVAGTVFFTANQAEAHATAVQGSGGQAACSPASEAYAAVCAVVAELPPCVSFTTKTSLVSQYLTHVFLRPFCVPAPRYICNRDMAPRPVTYFGAAAGIAHMVYVFAPLSSDAVSFSTFSSQAIGNWR